MATRIQPYTEDRVPAVKEFNRRLRAGGVSFQFPEEHFSSRLPKLGDRTVYQEYFLAVEGDQVRGGYILKHQNFSFGGRILPAAFYRLAISEGAINRRYGMVALQLLRDALQKQPRLIALGMGGIAQPIAKLLQGSGWSLYPVAFHFQAVRAFRFLRGLSYLRTRPHRRWLLDLLAMTGVGCIGLHAVQRALRLAARRSDPAELEIAPRFDAWAEELWVACKDHYRMIAARDPATLNALYPEANDRYIRLKVMRKGAVVGWAVVLDTQMSGHKQFGNLRVGSIADVLARPEESTEVVRTTSLFLRRRGVDLIVSNQCHRAWSRALRDAGFLQGPSNFILGLSPAVAELVAPARDNVPHVHFNRGDGDGPLHL